MTTLLQPWPLAQRGHGSTRPQVAPWPAKRPAWSHQGIRRRHGPQSSSPFLLPSSAATAEGWSPAGSCRRVDLVDLSDRLVPYEEVGAAALSAPTYLPFLWPPRQFPKGSWRAQAASIIEGSAATCRPGRCRRSYWRPSARLPQSRVRGQLELALELLLLHCCCYTSK
jgi:hypothetical protein